MSRWRVFVGLGRVGTERGAPTGAERRGVHDKLVYNAAIALAKRVPVLRSRSPPVEAPRTL